VRIDELKKAKDRRPFQPFLIRTADGREIEMRHPDAIAWGNRRIVSYVSPTDDWEVIDIALVTSLLTPASPAETKTEGDGE
jgi:hypothetical protein